MDACEALQNNSANVSQSDLNGEDFWAILSLAYAAPTFCLSFRIIMVLVDKNNKDKFNGAFYTFFIFASVSEFFHWTLFFYYGRASGAPVFNNLYPIWLQTDKIIGQIANFLHNSSLIIVMLIPLLISINRMTAVKFPISHNTIWKKISKFAMAIVVLFPLTFTWQFFLNNDNIIVMCKIIPISFSDRFYFKILVIHASENLPTIILCISLTVAILCSIVNMATFFLLIKKKFQLSQDIRKIKEFRMEMRLFFVSLLISFNGIMYGLIEVGWYLIIEYKMYSLLAILSPIQKIIIDSTCLTSPWILIILCVEVRQKVLGKLNLIVSCKNNIITPLSGRLS